MKMIVGLGNLGSEFKNTRHNTGFMTVDELADQHNVKIDKLKGEALCGSTMINNEKVLLVKPTTMMNESGRAVKPLMSYFKINIADVVVVYDDMDLPVGKIRLRTHGSAGGHNGIKSLINHLKTDQFNRVRIGTGHPEHESVVNYVLSKFSKEQAPLMDKSISLACDALNEWIEGVPFSKLENEYN